VATDSRSSGVRLELLWALATMLSVLAVLTWRCALDPREEAAAPAAGSPASTATSTPLPFTSCGEEPDAADASLNLEARNCLLAAAAAGTRVEFNTTISTVEGQPVYWRIRILAWGDVEITIDNRGDEFAGPARRRVATLRCTSLSPSPTDEHRIDVDGCANGETLTF
jgi:hypothetical protein